MVSYRFKRLTGSVLIMLMPAMIIGCPWIKLPTWGDGPDPAEVEALEADNDRLQQAAADHQRALREREVLIGRLQVQLLERDARYQALVDQMASQQSMLDEAVVEVVRTKAKLRSIESRAEAASSITEAEISLRGLKESIAAAGGTPGEDYQKAESLLRMSTNEFKKENYGGALFLAGQSQSHIRAIQNNLSHQGSYTPMPGEVLFAQPLPLKVLKRSNLRQGPTLRSKVVRILDRGKLIIGYSYKEEWVRVNTEDGHQGWLFQTLVGGR